MRLKVKAKNKNIYVFEKANGHKGKICGKDGGFGDDASSCAPAFWAMILEIYP